MGGKRQYRECHVNKSLKVAHQNREKIWNDTVHPQHHKTTVCIQTSPYWEKQRGERDKMYTVDSKRQSERWKVSRR